MLSQGVNRGADPEAGRPHRYSAEQPESRCLLCSGAAGLKVRELEVLLHPTRRALLAASPRVAPSLDTRVCAVQLAPGYCLQQRNRRKETPLHLELRKGLPSCVWPRASWRVMLFHRPGPDARALRQRAQALRASHRGWSKGSLRPGA